MSYIYVLYVYYMCIICVLYMYYICIICVLHMYYICIIYVLYMYYIICIRSVFAGFCWLFLGFLRPRRYLYVLLLAFAGFSWVFGTPHGRTSNSGGPPTRFCPNRFLADLQLGIDGIVTKFVAQEMRMQYLWGNYEKQ